MNLRLDQTLPVETAAGWTVQINNDDAATINDGVGSVHYHLRGTGPVAFDLHSTPFEDGSEVAFTRLWSSTTPATITLTGDGNGAIAFAGAIVEDDAPTASIQLQPGESVRLQRLDAGNWRVVSRTPGGSGGVSPYKNVSPEQSNGTGNNIGPTTTTFTVLVGGKYIFDYFGDVVSNTGGITITRGGTELFVSSPATGDTDGARLSTTRQSNFTPPITLVAGDEIEVAQWAGGGGLINDHTYCARVAGESAVQSVAGSAVDDTDPLNPVVDACAINEFIHSGLPAFHLVFAHEGDGGTSMVVRKNGDPVAYQNLNLATDAGNGQVNFGGGANSNYNRRASTVETIQFPGDYFEIIKPATPPFDSEFGALSTDPTVLANTTLEWRWFWTESNWRLRSPENTNAEHIALGGGEVATYRIERTLAGFEFRRNGVLVHNVECEWTDYTQTPTAAFVVDGVSVDAAPPWEGPTVSIADGVTTVIPTGVDLNDVEEVRVTFGRSNATWGKIVSSFDPSEIDLDVLQGKLLTHFDQTYLGINNMTAAQFAAGDIPFRAVTGSTSFGFEVSRIEFKKRAVVEDGRGLIFDSQANTNTTQTLDGKTWQQVVDRYEGIQASMLVGTRLIGSTFVSLDDFQAGGSLTLGFDQAIHATLGNLQLNSGDFGFNTTSNATNADRLKIWGVLPHGRVSSLPSESAVPLPLYQANTSEDSNSINEGQFFNLDFLVPGATGVNVTTDEAGAGALLSAATTSPYALSINDTGRYRLRINLNAWQSSALLTGVWELRKNGTKVDIGYTRTEAAGTEQEGDNVSLEYVGSITPTDQFTVTLFSDTRTGATVDVSVTDASLLFQKMATSSSATPAMPFLPIADPLTYFDPANVQYEVTEHSNGTASVFNARSEAGVFERFTTLPDDWFQFTPLLPTQTVADAYRFDWFQDANAFIMRPRSNRALPAGSEVFIEGVAYGEITGLNPAPGADYTYEFLQNPDGTFNHLFTFAAAVANGQLVLDIGGDNPGGSETGTNNPADIAAVPVTSFSA